MSSGQYADRAVLVTGAQGFVGCWLAERLLDAGAVAHPLSWHRSGDGPPGLVLGYAATTPDRLHEAVARIATVLARPVRR